MVRLLLLFALSALGRAAATSYSYGDDDLVATTPRPTPSPTLANSYSYANEGGCTPGWVTHECRDDGTLMHGYGCASCDDCEAFDLTAETGGRVTCEPGTSPIVFYNDEDLDGTTDDTWEDIECGHNDCSENDDGGGGSDDGGGDDEGGCTPGWVTWECRDDGTLMHGYGCTSCEECDASDWTAVSGGRVTCEPGTSPIVFYYDNDLDGTTDETWDSSCTEAHVA